MKVNDVVIGKRVTIGAAVKGVLVALAIQWPDKAAMFTAIAIPLTFIAQTIVARYWGITT